MRRVSDMGLKVCVCVGVTLLRLRAENFSRNILLNPIAFLNSGQP